MHNDYAAQEMLARSMRDTYSLAAANLNIADQWMRWMGYSAVGQQFFGPLSKLFQHSANPFDKQPFGLSTTQIGARQVAVTERIVLDKPFGDLLHFVRDTKRNDPKVLVLPPMSGHNSTLMRGPIEALLPYNDVYTVDWKNPRDVPLKDGNFGLDDYVQYIEDFLDHLGPNTHVVAVCQPTVPLVAAVARMAERRSINQPLSMSLVAGPLDTRINPTEISRFALSHPMDWFKKEAISTVPAGYAGEGRKVYPGFKQLMGFVLPKMDMHARSHMDLLDDFRRGDTKAAEAKLKFHNEFYSVMDMADKFFLETVEKVFRLHSLPKGELIIQDQLVRPEMIRKTAILTLEGKKDEIVGRGQTKAVHLMANNLSPRKKFHHEVANASHFAAFDADIWKEEIGSVVAGFIRETSVDKGLKYSEIPTNTRLMPPNFWQKIDPVNHALQAA